MKLVLVDDDGEMLDFIHCHMDELSYAMEDGGAATVLLGSLLPMRYGDAGATHVYIANARTTSMRRWDDNVNPCDIMTPEDVGKIRISE